MAIVFNVEDVVMPDIHFINLKRILKEEIVNADFRIGEINYIFCSDKFILEINRQYLSHDYFTDVITFDYSIKKIVSGDIFISTDCVLSNSSIFSQSYEEELIRVISHGLLHLLKYNDKEPEEILIMREKESYLISRYYDSVILS
jgi:rRNA maturation RNase YbeY